MQYFTTANLHYFEKNTKQLIASFEKYSKDNLLVYSEDMPPRAERNFAIATLKRMERVEPFQTQFRAQFRERFKFLYYLQRMDIWVLKIATILQHLEETDQEYSIFIDSDSVITNTTFDQTVSDFIAPFIASGKDIAVFRRSGTHLHTESGFAVFRKSQKLIDTYREMLEFTLSDQFYRLASWTDCSVIDHFVDEGKIACFDFCEHYALRTTNPVYESALRQSMLHLKGPRKGGYSILKRVFGLYR